MFSSETFQSIQKARSFKNRIMALLPLFSILVILIVFWWLKLIGITLAGDAFCGKEEHTHSEECTVKTLNCPLEESEPLLICSEQNHSHTEECYKTEGSHLHTEECYETQIICTLEEHTHVSLCFSDITADLETAEDWESTMAHISPGISPAEKIVAIAQSQIGYTESILNFEVDSSDVRHGYTRYGEWYGNPYGDWSNMFTSFCLRYAGLQDLPISAGADTMRLQWEELDLFRTPASYSPLPGDIIFLDKNKNGTADSTAVIVEVTDTEVKVIEGDLNNQVAETAYHFSDPTLVGYGLSAPGNSLLMMNLAENGLTFLGNTIQYSTGMFDETGNYVIYTASGSNYYAFGGNGEAIQIYIDENGGITADVTDPDLLLWTVSAASGTNNYTIRNNSTGRYMHAFPNNGTGVTTSGAYPSTLLEQSDGTVKIKSNSEFARLSVSDGEFQMTQNQTLAAGYRFGVINRCTVWLDGTNGGLMTLNGSLDKSYTIENGSNIKLPTEWQSPAKYNYTLRGWYDVKNSKYYLPGTEIAVTENLVFYADWVASTYDIGQFNAQTSNTVSTNEFITARMFDYSALFNVMSSKATVNVTAAGHTESWSLLQNGTVPYKNQETLNYIFRDWDSSTDISYPSNHGNANTSGGVHSGLYSDELREVLFGTENSFDPQTGEGIIGKQYLGTGDYLFQYSNDPTHQYYGYYYYDSRLNAASYNQSEQRFYVYNYLERTSDSANASNGRYSDFLPLNSPYANTNGKDIVSYTYNGENGEYSGTSHVQYDAKYSGGNNSTNNVSTNFWFGMSIDAKFYLPEIPGSRDESGEYGNRDVYGNEMHFKFSGDDDVWVLVDGELVLDLGGIHGEESGDINFSTGIVTVNGSQSSTIYNIEPGEHILTVLYLERGSSQSNCAMYFNLAPRYSLSMLNRKAVVAGEGNPNTAYLSYGEGHKTAEDQTKTYTYGFDLVKTDSQNTLLNGAKFKIYDALTGGNEIAVVLMDDGVTYRRARADETGVEIDVKGGQVRLVGFDNGTYYLEETVAPDGYNKLNARQKFIISDANLDATFNDGIFSSGSGVHVVNKTGSMLPETGGLGTKLFILIGGITVLGAGILLFAKKRMSQIAE